MEKQTIIIKKVKRNGHSGGHHGGGWKVAYADFVTAMMAFFLIMWLITMIAPEKRARVATYFKNYSIFEKSGSSFMEEDSTIKLIGQGGVEMKLQTQHLDEGATNIVGGDALKKKLRQDIDAKLADVKDQILVDTFQEGVRIQIIDKEGNQTFSIGSAELTPHAKKIIKVIAADISDIEAKLAIEGHTDALSYSSSRYTNWELSTDRASATRKELEINGVNPDRLVRVSGFAATEPLIQDNPYDPRNRRISVLLYFPNSQKSPHARN